MPLATASYVTAYAARSPYLTVAEYQNAPTAVDTSQLVPGGNAQANTVELGNVIARASSWVDDICNQVLAATSDVDPIRRYRVNAYGAVRVPLRYSPILQIDSVSVGYTPSLMQPLSSSLTADIAIIGTNTVEIPVYGNAGPAVTGSPRLVGDRVLVSVGYVNGYPNTQTSGSVSAAATQLPVVSALGIYVGTTLTVYDGASTEQITVTAVNGQTLTLSAPLLYQHGIGVSVSALPPVVKQAAILLTSSLIKTRGTMATVMPGTGMGNRQTAPSGSGGDKDAELATQMLAPLRRAR